MKRNAVENRLNIFKPCSMRKSQLNFMTSDSGHIAYLKRNEPPGLDNITTEIFKAGGSEIKTSLLRICKVNWEQRMEQRDHPTVTKERGSHIIVTAVTITLIDIVGKVFSTIMLTRVKQAVDERMRENQVGFRERGSCKDQMFCLNQKIAKVPRPTTVMLDQLHRFQSSI